MSLTLQDRRVIRRRILGGISESMDARDAHRRARVARERGIYRAAQLLYRWHDRAPDTLRDERIAATAGITPDELRYWAVDLMGGKTAYQLGF